MRGLYTLGIYLYGAIIRFAALFQMKAAIWVSGRKGWSEQLSAKNLSGCIWFHCASLGEFEQGRPLLEKLRERHPGTSILLTFFSPSGYEVRKNYPHADFVTYLPLDTPKNARLFLKITKPSMAIFVKYEIWHNFFFEISKQKIPLYMVAAIFRKNQIYFKKYGGWFLKSLTYPNHIFTQDESSANLLLNYGIAEVTVAGDTRFDRVIEISNNTLSFPELALLRKNNLVIVAGSTWAPDEEILLKFIADQPEIHLVLAPHETDAKHIEKILQLCPAAIKWSEKENIIEDTGVVVIDSIGILSSLYKYADLAYVGGGFGTGIHNTLEPAVFGIPVVFGPAYAKFKEACELILCEGAFSVNSSDNAQRQIGELTKDFDLRKKMGTNAGNYVSENAGATEMILGKIEVQ